MSIYTYHNPDLRVPDMQMVADEVAKSTPLLKVCHCLICVSKLEYLQPLKPFSAFTTRSITNLHLLGRPGGRTGKE